MEGVASERAGLEARYRQLVLHDLPDRGRAERWVVHADHCFGRIVLDHAVGGCWYDVLDRRRGAAFTQLDDDRLRSAVAMAERIAAEGDPLLRRLNEVSLAWRGHPPGRSAGQPTAPIPPGKNSGASRFCATVAGGQRRPA